MLSSQAVGFTTTSHYLVATEPGELLLDSQSHWDPEASSDLITYQRPLQWEAEWWRSPQSFDLTLGSISSKQFLQYRRIKVHRALSDAVQFRLHYLEERDFEQDRTALPVELRFRLTEKFSISAFGMTSLYKSEDDVGLSLFYNLSEHLEARLTSLWGDFQRNERNLQTDEWVDAPVSQTLSLTSTSENFYNFELHREPRSRRSDLGVTTNDLSYESLFLTGLTANHFGYRLLYDRALHSDYALNLVRERRRYLNQFEYAFRVGPHILRPGINLFYREHRQNEVQFVTREVLPTVWFELPPRSRSYGTRTMSLGYDATVFDQRHAGVRDRNLEHRLNIKSTMRFKQAGELALLFTFDLDRPFAGEAWEGGCGQFRLEF